MRALVFEQAGDSTRVLKVADVSDPTPADGQALIQVTARPIHPADLAFIRGQYRVQPFCRRRGRAIAKGSTRAR